MKKLVVAAFAVAFAAAAQAASVSWTIMNVKEATATGSSVNIAAGSYSAYLFVTANTTGVTLTTTTKAAVLDMLSQAHDGGDWTTLSASLASASAANGKNAAAGNWSGATGLDGFSTGSLTAFAVIFDAATIASANNYYVIDTEKTATFSSATGAKTLGFGTQATNSALAIDANPGTSWTSIAPEPTSGLMMLLGMGVLALRRRRA